MTETFQNDSLSLNLQENHQGIVECRGRIQGDCPVYLPDKELFSEKLVGRTRAQDNSLWGSWSHNGESAREVLGTTTEATK